MEPSTRMLGPGDGFEVEDQEQERGPNPLLMVHLLLQGRYWLVVLLAVICAGVAGYFGYTVPKVTYSSTGTIHIRPVISTLLFDKAGMMPMYESFVMTQIGFIRSERCLSMAMLSPSWLNGAGRSNSEAAAENFAKRLNVARDGEFIRVSYTDPDPKTSLDAVAAVINAYQTLVVDLDPENATKRMRQLEQLKADYETSLTDSKKQIADAANPYTPDSLRARLTYKLTESNQYETEWKMSQAAVQNWLIQHPESDAATQPATAATATASQPATTVAAASQPAKVPAMPKVYTAKQIADMGDAEMRQLLDQRNNVRKELDQLGLAVGEKHPLVVQKKKVLDLLDANIAEYAQSWTPPEIPVPNSTGAGPQLAGATPASILQQLKVKEQLDLARLKEVKGELMNNITDPKDERAGLETKIKSINQFEAGIQQTAGWLEETKQKLEEARVAAGSSGHILILSTGERPVRKDRRIAIAGASGFGGVLLGVGLVLVLGLFDRRLRTIDQARMSLRQGMRVLGMLPSLPKNLEDPSAASFAALCVHHIRMLLQVMPRLDGHPAIAVTSPSPGDGKTSLTLALALSYAASGRSTLLIDCDIVGAGLTRRVNALIRRRIGQILIRENLITPAELREALSAAQRTGRKLGEVLVDEGYVDADQLAKGLKAQGETSVGLLDVMRGEVLEDCVADTGTPRLWILPVGSALAEHGASISPEGFRAVLDQARKRFEVVLVDTGPIPGSIESSVACSQADGVVLTVSRGEQGPLVKRASEHLRDIGARALGIVFNRAKPDDFSSSYGSMSSPSIPERVRDKPGTAFGPVAAAVAGQQKSLKE